MEHNPTSSLFNLTIEPLTKSHLLEAAKWARFLSIVGMVALVLMVIFGLFFSAMFGTMSSNPFDGADPSANFSSAMGVGLAVVYLIIGAIWFFPLMYLLRFSNTIKTAVNSNDQNALNLSFQNLKSCFRYVGIVTIILLALYALAFIFTIVDDAIAP